MADTKIDFADALALAEESDPEKATGLLKIIQKLNQAAGILALLGIDVKALLKGLIEKHTKGKADTDAPQPSPAPKPSPGPAPAPTPAPAPAPPSASSDPFEGRVITSFRLKPFWYQRSAGSPVASKAEFDAIINRSEPMVPRSRLAVDCDILDQFGKEMFFGPEHQEQATKLLWFGPNDPELNTHRMRWHFDGGDDIADISESDNGFVPKIKIGKDALEENDRDYETGGLYGIFTRNDGAKLATSMLPSFRAKR